MTDDLIDQQPDHRRRLSRQARVAFPVLAFFLLGLGWLISSPPGSGVDEYSHFVRMIGLGRLQLIGDSVPDNLPHGSYTPEQLLRINREASTFHYPRALSAPNGCNAFDPAMPFACPQNPPEPGTGDYLSLHGRYLPLSYVVPAVFSRWATTTWRALLLGRLGFLVQNTVLFAVVVAALSAGRRRLGDLASSIVLLSVTPLLVFLAGTTSPSATETLAVVGFATSLAASLTLRSRRWWWTAWMVAAVATWTRDLGGPFVVLFTIAVLIYHAEHGRWAWERTRSCDGVAVAIAVVAALGAVAWQLILKMSPSPSYDSIGQLWSDLGQVPTLLRDSIGLLGWLNVPIDPVVDLAWMACWVATFVALIVRSDRRARVTLIYLAGAYVVVNMYLTASLRVAGFANQSRFTIAIPIVMAMLLAGTDRSIARVWLRVTAVVAAIGHFSAFLIMAHRQANGLNDSPIDFDHVAWSPPGGWPWVLGLFGMICLVVGLVPSAAERLEVGRNSRDGAITVAAPPQ